VADTVGDAGVLDGDAHPKVRRPWEMVGEPPQAKRSLSQYLIGVLRGINHHVENISYEAQRYPGVK
jgi:hypothetical protein